MTTLKELLVAQDQMPTVQDAPIELVIGRVQQQPVVRGVTGTKETLCELPLTTRSQEGAILAADTELTADVVREAIARMQNQ